MSPPEPITCPTELDAWTKALSATRKELKARIEKEGLPLTVYPQIKLALNALSTAEQHLELASLEWAHVIAELQRR